MSECYLNEDVKDSEEDAKTAGCFRFWCLYMAVVQP